MGMAGRRGSREAPYLLLPEELLRMEIGGFVWF